ncbi:hypothetical protein [Rhizobium sp. AG855]|uniref:hypothetical protein n=1 Tax=Rhizobium sp. AG855 TaxID=2183898 RepID=UPI001FE053D9|nr:hypothetical protein [Rhizobium sp. AG855]
MELAAGFDFLFQGSQRNGGIHRPERKAGCMSLANPKDRIHCACGLKFPDVLASKLRKLIRYQVTDLLNGDGQLV